MGNQRDRQFTLPKNIRQMGKLGETYKIYVEDFVYTYVHRTLWEEQEKEKKDFVAAVLLGRRFSRAGQEYIFISGAQQVDFSLRETADSSMHFETQVSDEKQNAALYFTEKMPDDSQKMAESGYEDTAAGKNRPAEPVENADQIFSSERFAEEGGQVYGSAGEVSQSVVSVTDTGLGYEYEEQPFAAVSTQERQQLFWERVYQGIKEYFSEYELLGWYFETDGGNLEVTTSIQQFFDVTQEHGSHFLYLADRLNRVDAFFVQEQGRLQRLEGYAVYYEKNPAMQEFLVAQNRHSDPVRSTEERVPSAREDVAQNYRAILNKLNEKSSRKKYQPFVYVAGVAVLAVVAATGISQIGNYQNLKTLEQTLQTFSGNVQKDGAVADGSEFAPEEQGAVSGGVSVAENGQASDADETQVEAGQASDANSQNAQSGNGENGQDTQGAGETGAGDGTQNHGADTSVNTAQGTGTDTSASNISQDVGGNSQTSGSGSDASGGAAGSSARYYTVKKGDSLMSISKAVYHTTAMIPEICNANQIENMDMIYEGQQLLLP